MENKEKPTPEKYGWYEQQGFDDLPSGWMYEGGEEAYNKALKEWENKKLEPGDYTTGLTENEFFELTVLSRSSISFFAENNGAMLYDLNRIFHRIDDGGMFVGKTKLEKHDFINRAKNTFV